MISFLVAIICLIVGFLFYGKVAESVFGPDVNRETPAYADRDDVDYLPMPTWKTYLVQLLNIAGTGPIFGALSGALFGPIVYFWIVLGCIFGGAVHDYFCGMISVRSKGASVSELVNTNLGPAMGNVMRVFSVILLVMCGVVFTVGPAGLLNIITPDRFDTTFWFAVVMIYYFIATFLPIDKIIGKIYPLFGACLIIMALGVGGVMFFNPNFNMPEIFDNFKNMHAQNLPVWPFMFITVACGAVSGFHATQSPIMARCLKNEKDGKKVFYGAMISEGIIAMVWAAAGVTCYESSQALLAAGAGTSAVVYEVCMKTMGAFGGIIAMLGVIACPISSGDTAYRSARLTIADWFKIDQSKYKNRIIITIILLGAGFIISKQDYNIVWRYFSWSNQTLAMIVLWMETVYLFNNKKNYLITLVPAVFMTAVTTTYFMVAKECMGFFFGLANVDSNLNYTIGVVTGVAFAIILLAVFNNYKNKRKI